MLCPDRKVPGPSVGKLSISNFLYRGDRGLEASSHPLIDQKGVQHINSGQYFYTFSNEKETHSG